MKPIRVAPLAFLTLVSAASAAEIGGRYTVVGKNPDGSKYSGAAEISIASDTSCTIVWSTGGQTLSGICMRAPGVFTAAFGGANVGLVLYKILPDGTLDGMWTIANQQGVDADVLTPDRSPNPSATNPAPAAHAPVADNPLSGHGAFVK